MTDIPSHISSSPIDWNELLRITNHNETLAKEMLTLLTDELPSLTTQLIDAFHSENVKQVAHLSHQMKGSSCYCGATQLKDLCGMLEIYLMETPQPNSIKLSHYVHNIEQEVERILLFIRSSDDARQ